ncbi:MULTISPECIES: cellulase family glycosylhydrolase [Streptomyces]|uniref:Glycoside hydrolase family 5 domain-containing protein n=1 Tax=Streptomyces luteosporeus TaxID=173856 RepID=A0ABN3TYZ8_9ACTN
MPTPTRRTTAVLAALTAVLALLTPTVARAHTGPGIPRLTDEHGRVLELHGWNLADKDHRGEQALADITEDSVRDLAAHGFDLARLAVFWDDLEPAPGQYSERYLRKIERVLDWAHRHRLRVVVDAHQDVYGPAFGGHRGIPAWATRTDGLPYTPHPDDWFSEYFEPGVQAAFEHLYEDPDLQRAQARMWRILAGRLAGHPALLGYDLINEPMGRMRPGEDMFAAARRIEATQITPMYNRIAAAVRSVDRTHWLFVEPTPAAGEGRPTGLGRIRDTKVVYAPHFYNAAMEAGRDYDPSSGWLEAYEAAVVRYPREHRMPVVVGEWGPLDSSLPHMGRFYEDALASIRRYASGWASWQWCYGETYCALDRDGRWRPNKERTAQVYATAVAGVVRGASYDAEVYRLSYVSAGRGGVTEVSVPPSWQGRRVDVSGPARAEASAGRTVRVRAYGAGLVTVTVGAP